MVFVLSPCATRTKQIEMLESLVQREVEERHQLMTSFNKAREELLRIKQNYRKYLVLVLVPSDVIPSSVTDLLRGLKGAATVSL